jgi:predicted outer membrane repeat protein
MNKLRCFTGLVFLGLFVSCSNPYVEELLRAGAALRSISVTSEESGTPSEINYGVSPQFSSLNTEYTVMVPKKADKVYITGVPDRDETIVYYSPGKDQNTTGIFDFPLTEKTMWVDITVSRKSMNTTVYHVRVSRLEYPWVTAITINADTTAAYAYPFTPGFNGSLDDADAGFSGYDAWVSYNAESITVKAVKRTLFPGDEDISVDYEVVTCNGIPFAGTQPDAADFEENGVTFAFTEGIPASTDYEMTIKVTSSYLAEEPDPVTYTIRIRRPAQVIAVSGIDEACFSISGTGGHFFNEGEPVSFTVTPPFGNTYTSGDITANAIDISGTNHSVTLYPSGPDRYTFIMPQAPDDDNDGVPDFITRVELSGNWTPIAPVANTRYVWEGGEPFTTTADTPGNATAWRYATNDLQALLDSFDSGANNFEIWIAKGTIKPDWTTVTAATPWAGGLTAEQQTNWDYWSFVLKDGARIYGGFAGTEATLLEKESRNIEANKTILSGFDKDKGYVRHLVIANRITTPTLVEGLTLTETMAGGRVSAVVIRDSAGANPITIGENPGSWRGAGIYAVNCNNNLVFNKVTIKDNFTMYGAAAFLENSAPVFRECVISGNSAYYDGGVFYITGATATPLVENCVIELNRAGRYGGAIYTTGSAHMRLVNTLVRGCFGGTYGGAVYAASNITAVNVTITGNEAVTYGGGIYRSGGTVTLNNSILWGNDAGLNNDYYGAVALTGNYSHIGVGVTVTGANNYIGVAAPGFLLSGPHPYSLVAAGPCVNAGDNVRYDSVPRPADESDGDPKYNDLKDRDLAGNPRKVGGAIDIGAYERQ